MDSTVTVQSDSTQVIPAVLQEPHNEATRKLSSHNALVHTPQLDPNNGICYALYEDGPCDCNVGLECVCDDYDDDFPLGSPTQSDIDSFERPEPPSAPENIMLPFLSSFTLFQKLAQEIRDMIWHCTLEPRTVELEYSPQHGFYSRNATPIALRVCSESRNAVSTSYPLSFGNRLHNSNIAFNFSLDTLYFGIDFQPRVAQFLASISQIEMESIQSIAVDAKIDEGFGDWTSEDVVTDTMRLASRSMVALREYLLVQNMEWHFDEIIPCGSGPMVLLDKLPYEMQKRIWYEGYHRGFEMSFKECMALHDGPESMTKGIDVPNIRSVFGWRPAVIPATGDVPVWMEETLSDRMETRWERELEERKDECRTRPCPRHGGRF